MILLRYPEGGERPDPAECIVIPETDAFSSVPELGALGPVFDQDDANLPAVQRGMKASKKGAVSLASYQESRIRHLHATLDTTLTPEEAFMTESPNSRSYQRHFSGQRVVA